MTRPRSSAVFGPLFLPAGCIVAEAAPSVATTKVAEAASPIPPAAVIERAAEPICDRLRHRLWVEGEGWIVRRITTCR